MAKRKKGQKNYQQNTTQKTKDWATRTLLTVEQHLCVAALNMIQLQISWFQLTLFKYLQKLTSDSVVWCKILYGGVCHEKNINQYKKILI
jgi:hypothetical protein